MVSVPVEGLDGKSGFVECSARGFRPSVTAARPGAADSVTSGTAPARTARAAGQVVMLAVPSPGEEQASEQALNHR
jgi:hypothetical protein